MKKIVLMMLLMGSASAYAGGSSVSVDVPSCCDKCFLAGKNINPCDTSLLNKQPVAVKTQNQNNGTATDAGNANGGSTK